MAMLRNPKSLPEEFEINERAQSEMKSSRIGLVSSPGFRNWLSQNRVSIAFNTYNVGKLFMVGVDDMNKLKFSDASFHRPMGLGLHKRTLWMGSQNRVWRFENFLGKGQTSQGHDAVFVPVGATTTGMTNTHDVRVSSSGVFFVASNFNCVAKLHEKWSFEPLWMPPFVDEFNYGDRCHVNCLALKNGHPKYVTCFADTNLRNGWRGLPRNQASGLLIDVQSNEIICAGLDMPHSPQLYRGTLYLANSGRGEFGRVDLQTGQYIPMCEVAGFTRGLAFWKHFALVGSSKPRKQGVFEGDDATPLNKRLEETGEAPECQISIIDLRTGERVHHLTIEGPASEIYDVCVLPGIQCPLVLDIDDPLIDTTFRPSRFDV